jgi:prepilin-type N-terminal cleavage/methylation domain-containing protein
MLMRSLETNAGHRERASGFSLVEMVTVVAISLILTVISVMSLVPMMKQQRITNAYNMTLAALRQARDNAASRRTSYSVTFANAVSPSPYATITVAWAPATGETCLGPNPPCYVPATVTYQLPTDVSFIVQNLFPSTGPDSYGTGITAIDFGYTANGGTGGQSTIYFCPDGSAQDVEGAAGNCAGSWDGGVVYLGRSGDLMSSRAITLWGGTGRIHGWRLYPNGGGYQWVRQ